jgi:hypothetical protein
MQSWSWSMSSVSAVTLMSVPPGLTLSELLGCITGMSGGIMVPRSSTSPIVVEFTAELWQLIVIEPATSTAYCPQTDGQTERVNQEMEQLLRIFTNYKQDDWDYLLLAAEFAYNNHIHSSTQQVPFMTDTGQLLWMGF